MVTKRPMIAAQIAMACQLFWAVGTSLTVEPAASLCAVAVASGAELTIVNADTTPYDHLARDLVPEKIGEALPRMVSELINSHK